ncbi:MAG: hypothetical protein WC732_03845 [Candidatus Omnitrophota bacterium]
MFFGDFLIVLLVTLVLTALFTGGLKRRGPWASSFSFFSILLLSTWGIGLWIIPFGPAFLGVYWLPYLLLGLVLALLLSAATPTRPPRNAREAIAQAETSLGIEKNLDAFFWVLLGILVLGILSTYLPARCLQAATLP